MKVARSALVYILSGVALGSEAASEQPHLVPAQTLLAASTGRQGPIVQHMYKRKNREDPANPVAAAATDPNEAAIMIKSRDLVPTDRPNFHPDVHHHRHGDQDDADSPDDNDDEDSHSEHKKGKSKSKNSSKADRNDENDADSNDDDSGERHKDGDDSEPHGRKSKSSKDSKAKGKGKDKDKDKAGSKQKTKGRGDDGDKKKKKKKNTHTGLDGNEVDDEDDESSQGGDLKHKKVKVKHVEAKQRHWRTGKPNYNYKKSLAGWKEVGPLYYYKGKYENAASPAIASNGAWHVLVPAVLAMGFAVAPFF
ncbi:hypothetical protein EV178_004799 [Coemansia sp. RSA 1646]|nr:hypothetical protein EV178_004799 [Coemansia sp. RSA 1646]KAJ2087595.1 hypothetical protein IW138_004878 [Coemansia sp. RSA 986]